MDKSLIERIELQNKEFNALDNLIKAYTIMTNTAVVDDDYPAMRHNYNSALNRFIIATKINRN